MYLKEFENVEVILKSKLQIVKWESGIGFKADLNKPFNVHWSILKTKSYYRKKFLKVKCDDCEKIFERRIINLNPNKNYHLCGECQNKGDRNGMFGKPINENFKKSNEKLLLEKGNPFTWDSVKKIIKDKQLETTKKIIKKNTGKKRTIETCQNISKGVTECYRNGKKKPGWGWNHIKVEKYNGIEYQGTYELNFLKFVENKNKLHLIERGPRISYYLNDVEHNYYVDYKIKNKNILFEIKSSYYWKKKEEINILKKQAAEKEYQYYLIINKNYKEIENVLDKL